MIDRLLLLFAKTVRAGEVKTRLIGEQNAAQVARLYDAFLQDLIGRLGRGDFQLRVLWATAPGEKVPVVEDVDCGRQSGVDLGERLYHGLAAAAESARTLAVVGSDHPDLPLSSIQAGFQAVENGREIALGPTPDGGYYLLALKPETLRPELFAEIQWSTSSVAEETLARCRRLGYRVALLAPEADVDRPVDLPPLAARLSLPGREAPHTAAILNEWGVTP